MNQKITFKEVIAFTLVGVFTGAGVANYLKVLTPSGGSLLQGTTYLIYTSLRFNQTIVDEKWQCIYQFAIALLVGIGITILAGYGLSIAALAKFQLCSIPGSAFFFLQGINYIRFFSCQRREHSYLRG